jgi:hypothetical protein
MQVGCRWGLISEVRQLWVGAASRKCGGGAAVTEQWELVPDAPPRNKVAPPAGLKACRVLSGEKRCTRMYCLPRTRDNINIL